MTKTINLTYNNCSLTEQTVLERLSQTLSYKKIKIVNKKIKIQKVEDRRYVHCRLELDKKLNACADIFVIKNEENIFKPYLYTDGHPHI